MIKKEKAENTEYMKVPSKEFRPLGERQIFLPVLN